MGSKSWTVDDLEYLRGHYRKIPARIIAEKLRRSETAIKAKAAILGLQQSRRWTPEQLRLLKEKYPDMRTQDLAKLIGRDVGSIYHKVNKLGLKKSEAYIAEKKRLEVERLLQHGAAHRFTKGSVPPNKGLRRPGYAPGRMAETQFKKGQRSLNWKPPGYSYVSKEGYVLVKVAEKGLFQWRFLHQDVWRLHHGRQPKGFCVAFKDGDKLNCEYTNLKLIPQSENMLRNSIHKYPVEVVPVMATLSELNKEIKNATQKQNGRSSRSFV
jgi:hypothetical protein